MRTRKHLRSRRSVGLRLEALEDRRLLSNYSITDLGIDVNVVAINNNSQVAGTIYNPSTETSTAFLYSQGTLTTLTGIGNNPTVTGLNDSGEVAGFSSSGGFLWNNGIVTSLPFDPAAISDNGVIVVSGDPASVDQSGTITVLPNPDGGDYSYAVGISNNGQYVAGYAPGTFSTAGDADPWRWNLANGTATDLGGSGAEATAANNSGQVTGFDGLDGADFSAFLYSSTVSGEKHGGTRFVEDLYGCFHS
jgi:uncharacterized membrane protein